MKKKTPKPGAMPECKQHTLACAAIGITDVVLHAEQLEEAA